MARTNKKLSKAALSKCATRHNWGLQWCWNYERMQASGFAWAMVPVMKELYDTDEEVCSNLERHMQFYNTHPAVRHRSSVPAAHWKRIIRPRCPIR